MQPSPPSVVDLSPVVKVEGTAIPAQVGELLRTIRVERGVRRVGSAELSFTDSELELLGERSSLFKVGAALKVSASLNGKSTEVFDGLVTGARLDYLADAWGSPPVLTVLAEERSSKLRHPQQTTVASQVTPAALVSNACSPIGLSVSVHSGALPDATYPTYLLAMSPLELLEQLCDTYGAEWWVDGTTLHVAKAETGNTVTVMARGMVASMSLETRNAGHTAVTVRGWDPKTKTTVVGSQSDDVTDAAAATVDAPLDQPMGTPGQRAVQTRARGLLGQSDLTAHAQGIALAEARQRYDLRLETLFMLPELAPRSVLRLTEAGNASGSYRVTTVVQVWDGNGGRTKVFCGSPSTSSLAPALASLGGRGIDTGALLVALVTKIDPPSEHPGCIQVKFPTLGDNIASAWARVAVPGAGSSRGFVVPHHVNDEVIVGFEEGDLQRPVVLGAVFGGTTSAPTATAGSTNGKPPTAGMTSENGHVLLVTDEQDQSKNGILLKHTKGSSVLLNDQGITVEGTQVPVTVKVGAASVVVDEQGNVTLKGTKVVLEGQAEVEIKAPTVKVAATAQLDLQSSATAALKGQASLEVSSAGITQVKGSLLKLN